MVKQSHFSRSAIVGVEKRRVEARRRGKVKDGIAVLE